MNNNQALARDALRGIYSEIMSHGDWPGREETAGRVAAAVKVAFCQGSAMGHELGAVRKAASRTRRMDSDGREHEHVNIGGVVYYVVGERERADGGDGDE